ncbi:YhbD family protein [Cohnella rhizosphaerae]|uniref:YhbD family protein n=1 Tax=Cohnella rhizosphaerae TaxID=1457232 RepID=A0A9X4KQA5_9BACL|nr:YhbD family protein [Cohnella rhizosphaerae]MDG0808553.1 YhbD family protein [Cohnella rhizosphaerae]
MERELISKRDLLEQMGISYGQLYRWKRKQLIPEEWFIRKSTFTGQETFFPKDMILARIDRIMNMKEDLSLDELAGKLSPYQTDLSLSKRELMDRNIVSEISINRHSAPAQLNGQETYSFELLLYFFATDQLLSAGEISLIESDLLMETLRNHFPSYEGKPCELLFMRKMGVSMFALAAVPSALHFDAGVKIVARLQLAELAEQLRSKLN